MKRIYFWKVKILSCLENSIFLPNTDYHTSYKIILVLNDQIGDNSLSSFVETDTDIFPFKRRQL